MPEREFTNDSFQRFLSEHRLMASRCQSCGALHLPPRPLCPQCYGHAMEWNEMSGQGELRAFTSVYVAPTAMIDAGYGRDKPYCSGIVKLREGPSISAQIVGVDATRPEDINIGDSLEVVFVDRGEDEKQRTFLAFEVNGGK